MRTWVVLLAVVLSNVIVAPKAFALQSFPPLASIPAATQSAADALMKTVAIGGNHRSYMTAKPLGLAIGLDVGIDMAIINTPPEFKDALVLFTGQATSNVPDFIPLPKLNIHKGLPAGFDIGFSYSHYQSIFALYGADVKWTLPFIKALDLAAQGSMSYTKLYFMRTHTFTVDAIASKQFAVLEPYGGFGLQIWNGDLDVTGLPVAVTGHQSSANPHVYGGLALKLFVPKLTFQADYSFASILTYGAKVSFNF